MPRTSVGRRHHGHRPIDATEDIAIDAPGALYTDRFLEALRVAAVLHGTQVRKGGHTPYISHLLGTCAIALEFGANEDQAIAALLHDVIEDIRPVERARQAVAAFGDEVLRIVEACTDSDSDPKPPWRERKERYLDRIPDDDAPILLVSASDKLYNARTIVIDLYRVGDAVWGRFESGRDDRLWYYRSLVAGFRANPASPSALVDALERTVDEMGELAAQAR